MRIARFLAGGQANYGIVKDDHVYTLAKDPFEAFANKQEYSVSKKALALSEVKLLAPCLPSKIVCLGVNYRPHAAEMKSSLPGQPLIFLKPPTAVIGLSDPIILPRKYTRVDFEGELGVVIGKKTKYVTEGESKDCVFGYTCFNDVTERQYQKDDVQWTRGKGFDTFAPIGPWIETEIEASDLKLETFVNGAVKQSARTSELVFGIPTLISFISQVMTLLPGDVIATGTPAGVGPLQPGDVVEIKIEKIGTLRNPVQSAG